MRLRIGDWVRCRGCWGRVRHIDPVAQLIVLTGWNGFKVSTFSFATVGL